MTNQKTKWTPGPWRVGTIGLTNDGGRPVLAESGRICVIDAQTEFKRGEGWKTECDEREANARLIAVAPELYAAMNDAAQFLSFMGSALPDVRRLSDRINAALTKARGDD